MRLSKEELTIIKSVILENIKDATIILFGSRIDDNKKGGDIDLFVETNENINLEQEIKILTKLELHGIDRKVDLIIKTPFKKEQAIFNTAKKEGIIL